MTRARALTTTLALVGGLGVATLTGVSAQSRQAPQRFTALAANLSNVGPQGAGTVEIAIERWSTDAERDRLMTTFQQKGEDALLNALQDLPRVGYIRTPKSIGYDLHFAREYPADEGGRRIFLATDRPVGFWEATNRPRTIDYPFTLIELHVSRDGEGEGKMSLFTKITLNKDMNQIELENYASQPVMLLSVRQTS